MKVVQSAGFVGKLSAVREENLLTGANSGCDQITSDLKTTSTRSLQYF